MPGIALTGGGGGSAELPPGVLGGDVPSPGYWRVLNGAGYPLPAFVGPNSAFCAPLRWSEACTLTGVGIKVSGSAAASLQFALWADDHGSPGALMGLLGSPVATSSAGFRKVVGLGVSLAPGVRCWPGVFISGSDNLQVLTVLGALPSIPMAEAGGNPVLDSPPTTVGVGAFSVPDPFGAPDVNYQTGPVISVKVSASA